MRILILRTSALGDIVHCLPALSALRRHLPEARIGWVVERSMAPLLAGHPDLDCVIPVGLRPWRKRPFAAETRREIASFIHTLAEFAADVVLDLMGNHKAGVLAALSMADRRVGLARSFRREPASALWINRPATPRGAHAVERALSVVEALGFPAEPADFGGHKLPGSDADANGDAMDGPLVIHPGAGWANKIYPPAMWGEVGRRLAAEGWQVRVAVGPGEEELAREVARSSAGTVREIEAPSLPQLVALLRRARLLLAGDTGPLHLAHALGTRVLAVMGPTDPATHGPYGAPENALFVHLPCSFCHKRFDGPRACLLSLGPERVAARAQDLLAAPGGC